MKKKVKTSPKDSTKGIKKKKVVKKKDDDEVEVKKKVKKKSQERSQVSSQVTKVETKRSQSPEKRPKYHPERRKGRELERENSKKEEKYREDRKRSRSPIKKRSPKTREKRSRSPIKKSLSSQVGAVISHDSDGEYDPEKLLQKAVRASEVKVTSRPVRPVQATKNLVLKAVADADKSIERKKQEEIGRDLELEEIHKKRLELSKALKQGKLDEDKLDKIRRKRSSLQEAKSSLVQDEDEELEKSDLRYVLAQNRKRKSSDFQGEVKFPRSGLLIQITNDHKEPDNEEEMLEEMRKRALESMKKNREKMKKTMFQPKYEEDDQEKKILIPLDEDTSDEESQEEKSKSEESSSDSDGSHSGAEKNEDKKEPTFIVTLKGVNKEYFKAKRIESQLKDKISPKKSLPKPTEVKKSPIKVVQSKVQMQPVQPKIVSKPPLKTEKPQAKVAPLPKPTVKAIEPVKKVEKPKRARITAPKSDPPKLVSSISISTSSFNTSRERCKFWPKCNRGSSCFFYHPVSASVSPSTGGNKFKWTSASILP